MVLQMYPSTTKNNFRKFRLGLAMVMKILKDTSAFNAILPLNDINARIAALTWDQLIQISSQIFSNNYWIFEFISLLQNKLGMKTVHEFQSKINPLSTVDWINTDPHQGITDNLLLANRRHLRLVQASFYPMRWLGIERAFTFDPHYA